MLFWLLLLFHHIFCMIQYLRFLIPAIILIPLSSHALSTTIVTKVSPTTLTIPKTQIVVPQTVAPSKAVVPVTPPTQTIVESIVPTSQIVAPQTPSTPLPQAPTNPPPTVSQTTIPRTTLSTETRTVLTQAQSLSTTDKIDIDIRTGSDNLEPKDCQGDPELLIYIRGKNPISVPNINNHQTWPNNSVRRVTVPLDGTVKIEDLESITIKRFSRVYDNFCATVSDNWNVDKVTVTASIKVNGRNQRTVLANVVSPGQGQPMFRFVYELIRTNPDPARMGMQWNWTFNLPRVTSTPTPSTTQTNARLSVTIATGGDNLEGGRDNNVNLTLKFKSSNRVVTINNINNSASWGNWTENTVTKEIPSSTTIDINDIKSVEIRHTGGGGISADNWHVDKIYITISKDGLSRVLVDKVGAPVHMFTGDTRRKTYTVE